MCSATNNITSWHRIMCRSSPVQLRPSKWPAGTLLVGWALLPVTWVKQLTPRDLGYCRSRWACATLALVLADTHQVKVSPETVRDIKRPLSISSGVAFLSNVQIQMPATVSREHRVLRKHDGRSMPRSPLHD